MIRTMAIIVLAVLALDLAEAVAIQRTIGQIDVCLWSAIAEATSGYNSPRRN